MAVTLSLALALWQALIAVTSTTVTNPAAAAAAAAAAVAAASSATAPTVVAPVADEAESRSGRQMLVLERSEGGGGNDNDECMGDGAEASTRQQDAVDAGDGLAVLAGHWEQPWDGAAVPEQGAMGGMGAMDAEGLLW